MLNRSRLEALLQRVPDLGVAVVGDLSLDAYWRAGMTRARLADHTPHFVLAISEESYAPGRGGNAALNALALGAGHVAAFSALGEDWRGSLVSEGLMVAGVDMGGVCRVRGWLTPACIRPLRCAYGSEVMETRLDFASGTRLPRIAEDELFAEVEARLAGFDVVLVCDQVENGVVTPRLRKHLISFAREHRSKVVIADSRLRILRYAGMILKPNEHELARALHVPIGRWAAGVV